MEAKGTISSNTGPVIGGALSAANDEGSRGPGTIGGEADDNHSALTDVPMFNPVRECLLAHIRP